MENEYDSGPVFQYEQLIDLIDKFETYFGSQMNIKFFSD